LRGQHRSKPRRRLLLLHLLRLHLLLRRRLRLGLGPEAGGRVAGEALQVPARRWV